MSSHSVRFPTLVADAPFALHGLPLASLVENSLRLKGLHGALAVLNATTLYRLTGVYRFDGNMVRSVGLFDRKNPQLAVGVDVPWQDSYCRLTAEDGVRCEIVDAPQDARLTTHAAREAVQAYVAVLLAMPDGTPFGTLCHYDLHPVTPPLGVFEDLDAAAPAFERAIWATLDRAPVAV
ncbi:MAG: hypothetical protein ABIS06_12785 [Vicinamibacterales bacterium]